MKDLDYERIKNIITKKMNSLWNEQKYSKLKLGEVIDIMIDNVSDVIINECIHDYWFNLWAFHSEQFEKELSQVVAVISSEEYFKYIWNKA